MPVRRSVDALEREVVRPGELVVVAGVRHVDAHDARLHAGPDARGDVDVPPAILRIDARDRRVERAAIVVVVARLADERARDAAEPGGLLARVAEIQDRATAPRCQMEFQDSTHPLMSTAAACPSAGDRALANSVSDPPNECPMIAILAGSTMGQNWPIWQIPEPDTLLSHVIASRTSSASSAR